MLFADRLRDGGRAEEALPFWDLALEFYPESQHAIASRARHYAAHGRKDDAIRDLEAAIARDPEAAWLKELLGAIR